MTQELGREVEVPQWEYTGVEVELLNLLEGEVSSGHFGNNSGYLKLNT